VRDLVGIIDGERHAPVGRSARLEGLNARDSERGAGRQGQGALRLERVVLVLEPGPPEP